MFYPFSGHQWTISQERWITVDLHIHSIYSGGMLDPHEIVENAGDQMLDAVGISDHNQIQGAIEAKEQYQIDENAPLIVISQEVSAGDHFHMLIIGAERPWPDQNRYQLMDCLAEHHERGGGIILAHPWTLPKSNWAREYLALLLNEELLDGVEMLNASITALSRIELTELRELWLQELAPRRLGVFGGSDFHHIRQGRPIGSGHTYLKVNRQGEEGIMDAIRKRRAVAGLNAQRHLELEWLGTGFHFTFGCDPWITEIQQRIEFLKDYILNYVQLDPYQKAFLNRLVDNGHFQHAYDLLM